MLVLLHNIAAGRLLNAALIHNIKLCQPIGPQFDAGILELVGKLQSKAKAVFLVSGGFRVIINPVAQQLNIPLDHVFANTILHKVCSNPPPESSHPYRVQSSRCSAQNS